MFKKHLHYVLFYLVSVFLLPLNAVANDKPKLSLVIDDIGYSLSYGSQAYDLAGDHTYAIIPNSVYAKKLASIGREKQKELIMHLPMQSSSHSVHHEANTLNANMSEATLIETTQNFLNKMPHISGINNHMGSHLTQYDYFMRPVMDTIYKHNPHLYFLDSRTSAKSKAYAVARRSGLKASKRNVFLDHSHAPSDIKYQFNVWLNKAKRGLPAIAIAHPTKNTLSVISPLLKEAQSEYQFEPLSKHFSNQQKVEPWPETYLSLLHKDAKISKP